LRPSIPVRWQTVVVAILFAASLGVLIFNSVRAVLLPRAEQQARRRLIEAAERVRQAIEPSLASTLASSSPLPEAEHERLSERVADALRDFPGVEGGIYLGGKHDQFTGYAFPTDPQAGARGIGQGGDS
jgi:hypothetical protein